MNFDPIETCPYDPVHRILRSRMQTHITKCAKNHPNSKMKQCPFDARHLINELEFNHHVSTCDKRESVIHFALEDKDDLVQKEKLLPIENNQFLDPEENWDNEPEVKSYNPEEHIKERPIYRPLICAPKSERKQFRNQERLKHQYLEKINVKKSKDVNKAKLLNDDQGEQETKPLRRPTTLSKFNNSQASLNDSAVANLNETLQETTPLCSTTLSKLSNMQTISNDSAATNAHGTLQETTPLCSTTLSKLSNTQTISNDSAATNAHGTLQETKPLYSTTLSKLSNTQTTSNDSAAHGTLQEQKPLRRPKTVSTLNNSRTSLNDSGAVNLNEILQEQKPLRRPKTVSTLNTSRTSLNDSAAANPNETLQNQIKEEDGKENLNQSSFSNYSLNNTVIEKLSKTVEEVQISNEEEKNPKASNQPMNYANMVRKNENQIVNGREYASVSNINKKFSRCAANFPPLK